MDTPEQPMELLRIAAQPKCLIDGQVGKLRAKN
jgi:hypothetical protein